MQFTLVCLICHRVCVSKLADRTTYTYWLLVPLIKFIYYSSLSRRRVENFALCVLRLHPTTSRSVGGTRAWALTAKILEASRAQQTNPLQISERGDYFDPINSQAFRYMRSLSGLKGKHEKSPHRLRQNVYKVKTIGKLWPQFILWGVQLN